MTWDFDVILKILLRNPWVVVSYSPPYPLLSIYNKKKTWEKTRNPFIMMYGSSFFCERLSRFVDKLEGVLGGFCRFSKGTPIVSRYSVSSKILHLRILGRFLSISFYCYRTWTGPKDGTTLTKLYFHKVVRRSMLLIETEYDGSPIQSLHIKRLKFNFVTLLSIFSNPFLFQVL